MAVSHAYSNAVADWTGTVTGFNSQGSTTTIAATEIVRPSDWNSAHNQFYSLAGNTIGNSTASGTNVIIAGSGGISVGGSTGTIVISGPAAGTATLWFPYNEGVNVVGNHGQGTIHIVPVPTPVGAALGELHIDRICFPWYFSNATNSTGTMSLSQSIGLYTRNANTISLAHSTSFSTQWTFSGTVNSGSQVGIRLHTVPWTTTIGDGRYYVGIGVRTSTGGANATLNQVLVSQMNSNFSGLFGVATNRSYQWPPGFGYFSASSANLPASIAYSQIDGTASLAARPPTWFMRSGSA